jgi:acyl-coenzyme A synthetase/AMP-(fatty) acid ligase
MDETRVIGERNQTVEHPRIRNVADLIFRSHRDADEQSTILLGCSAPPHLRVISVSLNAVRHHVLDVIDQLAARGIRAGDTVGLMRFARTNETTTALVYLALSAWGVRVLFPMYIEIDSLREWIELTRTTHIVASFQEVDRAGSAEDAALAQRVRRLAEDMQIPHTCCNRDLGLDARLDVSFDRSPPADHPRVQAMIENTSLDTESLLLTTSGTSGKSKLVRYAQGGYLRSCAAWEIAGFYDTARLGGRCLNLLLGHSMGLRALWNALWTRVPVCLITPEWFVEHHDRVHDLLKELKPEHVTGGPTVFGLVLQLFDAYPDLRQSCAPGLKCLVSSGAPYDPEMSAQVRTKLGLPLHNALGLTETMQVTSTVLGGEPPSLGRPLPGVQLRLSRNASLPEDAWRLDVAAPFGYAGYVGHPDAEKWFETGDLVELQSDDTVRFLGREQWDFLKDSVGVKLSRARIEELYAPLPPEIEAIEYVALHGRPGLGALVFVAAQAGASPRVPLQLPSLQQRIRTFFEERARSRADRDEFERRHMAVGRFVLLPATPFRTRKGNVAHARIEDEYAPLIDALQQSDERPGVVSLESSILPGSASSAPL